MVLYWENEQRQETNCINAFSRVFSTGLLIDQTQTLLDEQRAKDRSNSSAVSCLV
jgi:hypothetical protein